MDGAKNFVEDAPQEISPPPVISSTIDDQSAAAAASTSQHTYRELDISISAPGENLIIAYEVAEDQTGGVLPAIAQQAPPARQEKNKSLTSHEDSILAILPESVSSSTLEEKEDNATVPSSIDASDGHALEQDASVASARDSDMLKPPKEEDVLAVQPSPEDDHIPSVSLPGAENGSISQLTAKIEANSYMSKKPPDQGKIPENAELKRGQIDTAAPFESVKAAVSMFGGIVNWKAHRLQTVKEVDIRYHYIFVPIAAYSNCFPHCVKTIWLKLDFIDDNDFTVALSPPSPTRRQKIIEQELEKAQEEMPSYKKQFEHAQQAKLQVLNELNATKRLIEELKLNLERAQKKEQQARQDSELAKLRVEEIGQGIADEASIAAKAQLEVARARHAAAVTELQAVKDELEMGKKDYTLLVAEKDASMKEAGEALSTSKEAEKSVEDLTVELIAAKESLENARAAHMEAEEHRVGAVMAKEQVTLCWENDLKKAEEELEKVAQQILASKDVKLKLDSATYLLQDLKDELTAYMESKLEQEAGREGKLEDAHVEPDTRTGGDIEAALSAAKELEEVKLSIQKTTDEVNILKVATTSLKLELEKEKAELAAVQQREGMASIAVASLEAELNRTKSEIAVVQMKEKEERDKMVELPKQLQDAAQEADQLKALAEIASNELKKANEEAEQVKAEVSTMESRLSAAQKEMEAAKASEKLALAAIKALVESESVQQNNDEDFPAGITLFLEQYYELSKRAHVGEEQANILVAAALSQIQVAKECEMKCLNKFEEASREMAKREDALNIALQKSEKAKERKLGVEQELRKWRAEHRQRRKADESVAAEANSNRSEKESFEEKLESKNSVSTPNSSVSQQTSSPKSYTVGRNGL